MTEKEQILEAWARHIEHLKNFNHRGAIGCIFRSGKLLEKYFKKGGKISDLREDVDPPSEELLSMIRTSDAFFVHMENLEKEYELKQSEIK